MILGTTSDLIMAKIHFPLSCKKGNEFLLKKGFVPTEMKNLIHPNEVVKALRKFVQDNRQPQK